MFVSCFSNPSPRAINTKHFFVSFRSTAAQTLASLMCQTSDDHLCTHQPHDHSPSKMSPSCLISPRVKSLSFTYAYLETLLRWGFCAPRSVNSGENTLSPAKVNPNPLEKTAQSFRTCFQNADSGTNSPRVLSKHHKILIMPSQL